MLARPMLASIFITTGISALKDPSYVAQSAKDAGLSEPDKLATLHGASNVVGGLALATGRFPRLAALGLAANLIPTTLIGHAFWSAPADQKPMQQINFFKNVGLLGGLLIAFADTGGRESLPHAVGRVSRRTTKKAGKAAKRAEKAVARS
ncbi:MAG: DoxX family protein [Frankiales bacterium]|jgi:putative oxidoreductase|nr:DoxX family protein [Frankiales bacterium]